MMQEVVVALIRAAARELVEGHAVVLWWGPTYYLAAFEVAYGG